MKHRLLVIMLVLTLTRPVAMVQAQGDEVTLQFWHTYNETSPENEMLVNTLIPLFEEAHPGIKVESVPFPYDEFRQTMLTALAGGEGPDLARLDIIWSPEFAALGVVEALDEIMPDFEELAGAVFPGPLSTNAYDGHTYGLPLDTNTRVFMWNPTLYEQAGLEGAPATIDELAAQCEAVTALGEDIYLFGGGGTYGRTVPPCVWRCGGALTEP